MTSIPQKNRLVEASTEVTVIPPPKKKRKIVINKHKEMEVNKNAAVLKTQNQNIFDRIFTKEKKPEKAASEEEEKENIPKVKEKKAEPEEENIPKVKEKKAEPEEETVEVEEINNGIDFIDDYFFDGRSVTPDEDDIMGF